MRLKYDPSKMVAYAECCHCGGIIWFQPSAYFPLPKTAKGLVPRPGIWRLTGANSYVCRQYPYLRHEPDFQQSVI
jgi:hypothetical protein